MNFLEFLVTMIVIYGVMMGIVASIRTIKNECRIDELEKTMKQIKSKEKPKG